MGKAPYQDVWRDGKLVKKGRRDCAGRFDTITAALKPFAPASVADIGGWDGYFARRFHEAGLTATIVERRNVPDLGGIAHVQIDIDADNINELWRHDAMLALAVLHHLPDWEDVYARLRAMCDVLVVEPAVPAEASPERPQSPTLIETGPRIGPVHDRVLADGDAIGTTSGPNDIDRPLVLIRNTWDGEVEDGSGLAAPYMENVDEGHWEPLGYQPHPGTLNLKVGQSGKRWTGNLPGAVDRSTEKLPGPYWPVTLCSEAGEVDGHVRHSRARTAVECVAPVNLRDELGVANGDTVTLRVR